MKSKTQLIAFVALIIAIAGWYVYNQSAKQERDAANQLHYAVQIDTDTVARQNDRLEESNKALEARIKALCASDAILFPNKKLDSNGCLVNRKDADFSQMESNILRDYEKRQKAAKEGAE